MPKNQELLNTDLFGILRSRGYSPTMLSTSGKEIPVPEEAEVFQFTFTKDGEEYGTVTLSIDGLHKLVVYSGDDVASSPTGEDGGTSWYTLLKQLKRFSQQHQLSFEIKNSDHLKYDMAKRNHTKVDEAKSRKKEGTMSKKMSENAKWRQGYSASGHPAGYKHTTGEVGPVGGTFTNEPSGYDGETSKVPVQKHRDQEDQLKSPDRGWKKNQTKKQNTNRIKRAVSQAKGKHGPASALPESKDKVAEGYHATGRKSSYSDNIPEVKIILQHSRPLEEGEKRYRSIEKIFVENAQGERFAVPTNKPGLARVYARHIAEGGTPYDQSGKHITELCEEYSKMAGFVRATRSKQFNESTQSLVNEGINHYQKLRETLHKMAGHRGYNAYFESWSPTLTEDEDTTDLSEMFATNDLDPRIESVMPILRKLNKTIAEMTEVDSLSEWADDIIEEAIDVVESYKIIRTKPDGETDTFAGGFNTREQAEKELAACMRHSLHTKHKHDFKIAPAKIDEESDCGHKKMSQAQWEEQNAQRSMPQAKKDVAKRERTDFDRMLASVKKSTGKKSEQVDEVSAAQGRAAERDFAGHHDTTVAKSVDTSTQSRPWTLVLGGKVIATDKNVGALRAIQTKRGGKIVRQGQVAEGSREDLDDRSRGILFRAERNEKRAIKALSDLRQPIGINGGAATYWVDVTKQPLVFKASDGSVLKGATSLRTLSRWMEEKEDWIAFIEGKEDLAFLLQYNIVRPFKGRNGPETDQEDHEIQNLGEEEGLVSNNPEGIPEAVNPKQAERDRRNAIMMQARKPPEEPSLKFGKKYPDSEKGVIAFMNDPKEVNKSFTKSLDIGGPHTSVWADDSVEGVWAVDNYLTGTRVIVYLGGYKNPMGEMRDANDFEEGEIPLKVMKRYREQNGIAEGVDQLDRIKNLLKR